MWANGWGLSTKDVWEIGELVRNTHHVHPYAGKSNKTNTVIIYQRNKEKEKFSAF